MLGFAFGQGFFFIALSYLVVSGEVHYIGSIGGAVSVLTFATSMADYGGLVILSKYASRGEVDRFLGSVWVARLFVASIVILVLMSDYVEHLFLSDVSKDIIRYGIYGVIAQAFNVMGFLDGLSKSRYIGLIYNLNYTFVSVLLLLIGFVDKNNLGVYIGTAFSIGVIVSVLIQIKYLSLCFRRCLAYYSVSGRR